LPVTCCWSVYCHRHDVTYWFVAYWLALQTASITFSYSSCLAVCRCNRLKYYFSHLCFTSNYTTWSKKCLHFSFYLSFNKRGRFLQYLAHSVLKNCNIINTSFVHLYTVATVPWEIQELRNSDFNIQSNTLSLHKKIIQFFCTASVQNGLPFHHWSYLILK